MTSIEDSLELIGYRASYQKLPAFDLTGFTKFVQSGGEQYEAVRTNGQWDLLKNIGEGSNTIYGIASLDKHCPKDHYRYTVGVLTPANLFERTDDLFTIHIAETEWIVFELESFCNQYGKFWQDDPYKMIRTLGWDFNNKVPLHLDVYAPSYVLDEDPMAFWMPVKPQAAGD